MRGSRALQIFHGDLERKERIFQFVRQAAGQLTPGSHAFGLHQTVALFQQIARHPVKAAARSPISSAECTSTCVSQSPAATARAPAARASTGRVMRAVVQNATSKASTTP